MHTTYCIACNKKLISRRPQTKSCNAACRSRAWRQSRIAELPVSFMLSIYNYTLAKNAANAACVPVNQFAHDCLVRATEGSHW